MKCPKCDKGCSSDNKFCPNCGNDFSINPLVEGNPFIPDKGDSLKFGSGVQVWLILCIVFQSITIIRFFSYNVYLMPVVAMLSVISNLLLLLCKKKVYYYFIVISVFAIFIVNIFVYNVSIFSALIGFLNPVITFLAIKNYWKDM